MKFRSIPAHPDHPEQECVPPCGGSWTRNDDGSLTPGDEHTARAAGLLDDDEPEATPVALPAAD